MPARLLAFALVLLIPTPAGAADDLTLEDLVTPSAVFVKDGEPVTFALLGFIQFKTLEELFSYIDREAGRWSFPSPAARRAFGDGLLRRGVESRLISMSYERPLELLLTHTRDELERAALGGRASAAPVFTGRHWRLDGAVYRRALLDIQQRWKTSLNCWSAAATIPARVLSNWYPIEEGIELHGALYDSTEHFWQAVKFHPEVRNADLVGLLDEMKSRDWSPWVERLAGDQTRYFANPYAIEFLKVNLTPQKLGSFREDFARLPPEERARQAQQRRGRSSRFSALQEKLLWGDLADTLHLIWHFDPDALPALGRLHFDAVYLGERKLGFLSPEFRALMLEIWRTKFLKMARFGEVISSIPRGVKLDHFLNDGDSPDIPIPVYVGYLNEIRELAWAVAASASGEAPAAR
jgi:hypothetical protein